LESAVVVVARRGKSASARSSSVRRGAISRRSRLVSSRSPTAAAEWRFSAQGRIRGGFRPDCPLFVASCVETRQGRRASGRKQIKIQGDFPTLAANFEPLAEQEAAAEWRFSAQGRIRDGFRPDCPLFVALCGETPQGSRANRRKQNQDTARFPTLAASFESLALLGRVKSQFVHVEKAREPVAQGFVDVDHEPVVDVVPGLNDLQLRFGLGQPTHHVDLEQ
jgi:hypothetical protein